MEKQPNLGEDGELKPAAKKDNIAICYATDEKYASLLGVSLLSLLEHASPENFYDIVVLYRWLSEKSKKRLEAFAQTVPNASIRLYDMSVYAEKYEGKLMVRAWWGIETWFKIFLAEVFRHYARVLMLDVDTIIEEDVAKLHRTRMGNQWVAGCRDLKIIRLARQDERFQADCKRKLGLDEQSMRKSYINAGVLLCNIREWKKCKVGEKLLNVALDVPEGGWRFLEQDVLNSVCHEHIFFLNQTWDTYPLDNEVGDNDPADAGAWRKACEKPRIIHYVIGSGLSKPWINPGTPMGERWWSYARKLPYYEELLYTNICSILRGELNKKITEQANRLTELGKALTELGRTLTGQVQPKK